MRNKGFTLLELLIVVIVIAVLATIALPQFTNVAEQGRESKAMANLRSIAETQRRLEVENGLFTNPLASEGAILAALGIDAVADTDWNYAFTVLTDNTFTIDASRTAGRNTGEGISLSHLGVWTDTFTP